jgi:DNA adenine methylase
MPKVSKLQPPIKCRGSKPGLANWIINQFPVDYEQFTYIEPCAGGANVLLNKKIPVGNLLEIINDIDVKIVQIFRALRDEPKSFIGRLRKTKLTLGTFERAKKLEGTFDDYIDQAINEFILERMSRAGLKRTFIGEEKEDNWATLIEELPAVAKRIANINIFNKSAIHVIKAFDDEKTLCYCDPPCPSDEVDMAIEYHAKLAEALKQFKGKVLVSGISTKFYKRLYENWRCIKKKSANHTECLWLNY